MKVSRLLIAHVMNILRFDFLIRTKSKPDPKNLEIMFVESHKFLRIWMKCFSFYFEEVEEDKESKESPEERWN